MATVPNSPLPRVAPGGLSGNQLDPGMSPREAGESGRTMQRQGQQVQLASARIADIIADKQRRVNELKVIEAENRLRERALSLAHDKDSGFTALRGEKAVQRPNGNSLTSEYVGLLEKQIADLDAELTNDAQKELFRARAQALAIRFKDEVTRHELAEFRAWQRSVSEGAIDLSAREMVLSGGDPQVVDAAVRSIDAALSVLAEQNGWAQNDYETKLRSVLSQAHEQVFADLVRKNNLEAAYLYRERYKDQMDGDALLKAAILWDQQNDLALAMQAADEVFAVGSSDMSEVDFHIEILKDLEVGHLKTEAEKVAAVSPAGAVGVLQVMPGTGPEAARLAGLPWDEQRYRKDGKYQLALGKAYYVKLLQDFGHPIAAMVAYNAGPTVVRDWIEGTNRSGKNDRRLRIGRPDGNPAAWVAAIPFSETREYGKKALAKLAVRSGPSLQRMTYGQAVAALRADPRLAGNPRRLQAAEQRLRANWTIMEDDKRRAEQDAVNRAINHLIATGGDFSSLSAADRAAIPADKQLQLMDLGTRLAERRDVTSPRDMLALQNLLADSEAIRRMKPEDVEAWRLRLGDREYQELRTRWDVLMGAGPVDPKLGTVLRYDAIKRQVDVRLAGLNLKTTGKDADEEDIAREVAIRDTINKAIDSQQRHAGRQFSDAEIAEAVDELFRVQMRYHPGKLFTFTGTDKTKIEKANVLGMKVSDIPPKDVEKLRAALRDRGASDSDADVLRAYYIKQAMAAGLIRPLGKSKE